jgi:hypothetical protein
MRGGSMLRQFGRLLAATLAASSVLVALPAAATAAPSLSAPAASPVFTDVQGDEPYAAAAYALAGRTTMAVKADGSFDPEGTVSRAEMAYFLTRAMGLQASPGQPFFDVNRWDWFAGSVGVLFQKGLMQGTSPIMFSPARVVTRQEAITMVMTALESAGGDRSSAAARPVLSDREIQAWLGGFRDRLLIDPTCTAAVAGACRLGIVGPGGDGWLFPAGALTRAEMADMLYRAFLEPVAARDVYPQELPAASDYGSLSVGSKGPLVSFLQARLTALRYPCGPVDGVYSAKTRDAVMAFQKVERLKRTGRVNAQVWERLATATVPVPRMSGVGTRCEVDLRRQVLFMITDNQVTKVVHVSTGKNGTRTGHFTIGAKYKGWVECVTLDGRMYYPSYVVSKTAIHGFPSVPSYPASHGCVRVPVWTAEALYHELPTGTVVDIYR